MKKLAVALSAFFVIAVIAATASADMRPYTWSYGYMTPVKGEIELEWWYDFQKNHDHTTSIPLAEIEYGITDHWVAELSGSAIKEGSDSWKFDELKFEQRYRLFDPGTLPVDITLYFEYKHIFVEKVNTIEGKLILSKDWGKFNATANLIIEQDLKSQADTEYEYSTGVSYPVYGRLKAAIEDFGTSVGSSFEHYLGPSVLIDLGKVWINAGVGFGLTRDSDQMRARVIVSHELKYF